MKTLNSLFIILLGSTTSATAGPSVDYATASVRYTALGFGTHVVDVPLSHPVPLHEMFGVYVGPFAIEKSVTDGPYSTQTRVELVSGGEAIVLAGTSSISGADWSWGNTARVAAFVGPSAAVIDAVRFTQTTTSDGATNIEIRVRGLGPDDGVRVAFIRGSGHLQGSLSVDETRLVGSGATDWNEQPFFEPIPATHVRMILPFPGFGFVTNLNGGGSAVTQLELGLDSGEWIPVEDSFAPASHELTPGLNAMTHVLFVGDALHERLAGREFVNWRWRLVRQGEIGDTRVRAGRMDLFMLREFEDCDFDGMPDEEPCEFERFVRGDADGSGGVDLSDAIRILGVLFLGSDDLPCDEAGDVDWDFELAITDAILILGHLFLGERVPALLRETCEVTDETLGCDQSTCPMA